jgi:hypothetical protein
MQPVRPQSVRVRGDRSAVSIFYDELWVWSCAERFESTFLFPNIKF